MRGRFDLAVLASLAVTILGGCLGTGEDRVLSITATGTVQGFVFFDQNGNGAFDGSDTPLRGVDVGLASFGSIVPVFRGTSDADGLLEIRRVDVATYEVVVDLATVGDTAQVILKDPEDFTLTPSDTATVLVGISYRAASVEEVRQLPAGEKVFVEGIALNSRGTFGDNTVHLAGGALAIRVTDVAAGVILPGDSLRFQGTTDVLNGQPVVTNARAFLLAITEVPAPDTVTAAAAAGADGGSLDAALVYVDSVTVSDTATVAAGFQLTVDDVSGTLVILLDVDAPITDPPQYIPTAVLDVVGLLVPDGAGAWVLKPRSDADLTVR
ncbi:MAG TPA: hypothetical protein VLC48_11145 [Gemmatimonadota bacterium]|nr:hypothetical protein [Gemmatimonadota bacterium]